MKEVYILHTMEGTKRYTRAEIIENARQQEKAGITPRYKYNDGSTPAGWLVWSTREDGAGVVFKLAPEKYGIISAWQGDFHYTTA